MYCKTYGSHFFLSYPVGCLKKKKKKKKNNLFTFTGPLLLIRGARSMLPEHRWAKFLPMHVLKSTATRLARNFITATETKLEESNPKKGSHEPDWQLVRSTRKSRVFSTSIWRERDSLGDWDPTLWDVTVSDTMVLDIACLLCGARMTYKASQGPEKVTGHWATHSQSWVKLGYLGWHAGESGIRSTGHTKSVQSGSKKTDSAVLFLC